MITYTVTVDDAAWEEKPLTSQWLRRAICAFKPSTWPESMRIHPVQLAKLKEHLSKLPPMPDELKEFFPKGVKPSVPAACLMFDGVDVIEDASIVDLDGNPSYVFHA